MAQMAKRHTMLAALLAATLTLSACASNEESDPMEGFNRGVQAFNTALDKGIIRPVAKGYRYITPDPIRERVGNFSDNLREPVNMLNAFLQGDVQQGLTSFWRFAINSTIGILGINDVATTAGLKERREDFGQTLGAWGMGAGPYIVLPILGPSNGRDAVGKVVDWFTDPFRYYINDTGGQIAYAAAQGLVERERLIDPIDDIYETSLDPYVTFRSVYSQHRKAMIDNRHSDFDKSDESPAEYEEVN
jgi:phospholipid-binding lipoprotein MlaA